MALGHRDLRDIVGSAGSGLHGTYRSAANSLPFAADRRIGGLIEDFEAIQPGEAVNFPLLQEQLHSVLGTRLSARPGGGLDAVLVQVIFCCAWPRTICLSWGTRGRFASQATAPPTPPWPLP
jgi:hypothetical protein